MCLAKSQNSKSTHKNKFYFISLTIKILKFLKILFTVALKMKRLGIHLLKHILYVYADNYKRLIKVMKEFLNKKRDFI